MTKKIFAILSFIITFLFTVGCSNISNSNLITPWATNYLPTALALTMAAEPHLDFTSTPPTTPTVLQESIFTQTIEPEVISDLVTEIHSPTSNQKPVTLTPTPINPEAKIQIISPGTISKVISPINLVSYAQPGYDGRVYIELIGEDGQILIHESRTYQDLPRLWAPVNLSIPFESNAATEFARLQIYTLDQFKRIISLNSVNIFLQSDGLNRINLNNVLYENCLITNPLKMESITGGSIRIEGKFHPINQQPIIIDLITSSGSVVGTETIELKNEYINIFIPISIDIAYQVLIPTPALLTIFQLDARPPGYVYLYSQEIILNP